MTLFKLLPAFFVFGAAALVVSAAEYRPLGPADILVGEDPDVLFILEQDARQIRKIRVDAESPEAGQPQNPALPFAPSRMRLFPGGKHLAVLGGGPCGRLLVVEAETLRILADVPVGHTPTDVAIDGKAGQTPLKLYVANRFGGDISVVELENDTDTWTGRETRRIPAGREPIALTLTPDAARLVVAAHLPEGSSMHFDIASRVRIIDTQTFETTEIRLSAGAMNLRDVILDPSGRYACISGQIGHFQQLPNDVNGGWMNENLLFVIDLAKRTLLDTLSLDVYALGSANPWGLSLSDDRRFLLVAVPGSSEVLLVNLETYLARLDRFAGVPEGTSFQGRPLDENLRKLDAKLPELMRVPVGLKGIRHAVMTKNRIFATAYFEDALARVEPDFAEEPGRDFGLLPRDNLTIPRKNDPGFRPEILTPMRVNTSGLKTFVPVLPPEVAENAPLRFHPLAPFEILPGVRFERSFARLGPEPVWTAARFGDLLFHDSTLCSEHWQSCMSCHPDARSDTLNWDLLNDGQDNPKNSKSLLFSHITPPSMARGVRECAEMAVRKGFETILMHPCTEPEALAVDEYLRGLRPVPSPYRVFDRNDPEGEGRLSEAAQRGETLFNSDKAKCYFCHPAPLYTDLKLHDVRTQTHRDPTGLYDTPTLVEVWRTAPYLHDGRYTTVRQLITEGKHVNIGGCLDALTEQEIDDLVEFVLSL